MSDNQMMLRSMEDNTVLVFFVIIAIICIILIYLQNKYNEEKTPKSVIIDTETLKGLIPKEDIPEFLLKFWKSYVCTRRLKKYAPDKYNLEIIEEWVKSNINKDGNN